MRLKVDLEQYPTRTLERASDLFSRSLFQHTPAVAEALATAARCEVRLRAAEPSLWAVSAARLQGRADAREVDAGPTGLTDPSLTGTEIHVTHVDIPFIGQDDAPEVLEQEGRAFRLWLGHMHRALLSTGDQELLAIQHLLANISNAFEEAVEKRKQSLGRLEAMLE